MSGKDLFDRSRLKLSSLSKRIHDIDISVIRPLESKKDKIPDELFHVARRIKAARQKGASVIFMMGGHVIRSGVQRYIIDMMERKFITCLATNGSSVIHDFEFSLIGATTENVGHYISEGKFGLWEETGLINDIVAEGAKDDLGLGETIGRAIERRNCPYRDISIFAAGYRLGVPITVHVGIGYDITYEHPNCDGAAYGATSYKDFLKFARILENLENGVVMNFGSAVMAPEVYLKALAMARNIAVQENKEIKRFVMLVCDLQPLPKNYRCEPPKDHTGYYFRPWKTMLVRTVSDGGESYYVRAPHAQTIPALWTALMNDKEDRYV
jgi:hypothetical protein